MDNKDTNVDGRCRFHTSIQLYLLTRNGKWLQILKECPLCLAYNNISSKSNSILTTSQKSIGFTEQTNGELPPVKSSSPTSVIPMTYNRLATQMILPPLPLPTKEKTKATLTQTSSSPQLFLPSKSIVNRHDKEYVESTKLAVCRMNDEVCYVTTQKDCLPAVLVNNLIQEVSQSKRLMTRSKFEEGDRSDRTGSTHSTSSTTKSSISKSDDHSTESSISKSDDHSHKRSNSVPVSCFRRTPSIGSHKDSSAPSLSTYSTSQDSDCSSTSRMSFCSCDSLGRCIYHPNIQLKTRRTLEGLMTGKWKTIMTCCSECAFEKIQRLRQQILDTSDSIREYQHQGQLTHPSCNILNSLTCSEKDLMRRLISSCEEVDLSDRTDSTQSTLSSWTTKSSFSKSDDHSHKRSKSAPISCIRKRSTLSEGSKGSLNRVVFAEQDDIYVFVHIGE